VGDSIYPVQPGTIHQGQPLSVPPTPGLGGEPMPAPAPLPDGNTIPAPPKPRPLESRGNDVTFPTAHEGRHVVPTRSRRARSPRLFDRLGNGFRKILKPVAFRRSSPSHSQQVADPFFAVPSNHPRLTLPQHTTDHSPESLMVGHSVINNRRADPAPLHQPKPEFSTTPNPWKPSQLRQASPSALAAAPLSVPSDKPVAAITHWPYSPRVLTAEQTDARPIAMPTITPRPRWLPGPSTPVAMPSTQVITESARVVPQPTPSAGPSLTAPPTGLE
jgi:hypothetical protein